MRFVKKHNLIKNLYETAITYPSPSNFNYFYGFGVLALVALIIQLISGIFLAMHYIPNVDLAFLSVESIMRDVNYGWLIRYVHLNGASFFFLVVYIHIFRGLYYGSYVSPREGLWCVGVVIFLLMIITAFIGYVLPWGQMSFWGATVITNFASAVPIVGDYLLQWLWGGYSVDNPTLNRFFSLHYLLPFIITGLVGIHLIILHEVGSSNPIGTNYKLDQIPFHPYYTIKDLYNIIIALIGFFLFVFFAPNFLGHSDNYIPANPLVTPPHIVPEWYFLPFYAILRSVPDKLGGVLLLLASIFILILLPFYSKPSVRSFTFRPISKFFFWIFVTNCLILMWIGNMPIEEPYYTIGQIATAFYFLYFIIIIPFLNYLEHKLLGYL